MAYRGSNPKRGDLLETRRQIRLEHDHLQDRADALAVEIGEARLLLGSIANAFGRGISDAELQAKRTEQEQLEGQIAALADREREIDATLERIEKEHAVVAAGQARRLEELRAGDTPIGAQLRDLAAERTATKHQLSACDTVIAALDRISATTTERAGLEEELRAASTATSSMGNVLYNVAAVVAGDSPKPSDAALAERRLASQLELVRMELRAFLDAFEGRSFDLAMSKPVELAHQQLASMVRGSFNTPSARACLERLDELLTKHRGVLTSTLAELDARELGLLA